MSLRSPRRQSPSRSPDQDQDRAQSRSLPPKPRSESPSRSLTRSPSQGRRDRYRSKTRSRSPSRGRTRSRSLSRGGRRYNSRSESRSLTPNPSPPRSSKIVVEKLTKNVTENHIREIFGGFGEIEYLDLPINKAFMTNRGTAYILYYDPADAEAAIAHMHEAQLDGAILNVSIVLPRHHDLLFVLGHTLDLDHHRRAGAAFAQTRGIIGAEAQATVAMVTAVEVAVQTGTEATIEIKHLPICGLLSCCVVSWLSPNGGLHVIFGAGN
ncbi:uncharacterized protein N7479_004502 [Penicillium vulpinum]|uniref:uncharacterized protein n=1 Tax=Penicillium vulpinum TaxID=29845 RepID=UPI002548BD96|nr:uncharacterized protein N7479_004502 [Penicillium vulpinum]KAJ5964626.1 hypothetical protein N7479_004502 [Penicillium vulpinum]